MIQGSVMIIVCLHVSAYIPAETGHQQVTSRHMYREEKEEEMKERENGQQR
jgi:hypothetical protein